MKIGIMTYYFADNYGAVLQCYALKTYLESMGNQVEIIDYKPFDDRTIIKKGQTIKNIYRIMRQYFIDIKTHGIRKKQMINFENFRKEHFNIGFSDYDIVFLGSDQIWNPLINHFDFTYFGTNINSLKYVSYAASIGISDLNEHEKFYIKEGLKVVDCVSVREENAKKICENLTDKKIQVVVDPVFLINKTLYDKLLFNESYVDSEQYVLVYSLEHSVLIDEYAKEFSEKYGIKIKYIHPHGKHLQYADKYEDVAGPIEFLKLIKNASYIVSNSFHALAFSMIYEIPIISVMHNGGYSRQIDLIRMSQLEYKKLGKNTYYIPNNRITDTMKNYIEKSKSFISYMI